MKYIIIAVCIVLLVLIFLVLLQQSKHPKGFIGKVMMKQWKNIYSDLYRWSLSYVNLAEKKHILDIGIGIGESTKYIAEHTYDSHIVGVDISKDAVALARKTNFEGIKNGKVGIIQGDVEKLGLMKNSFDLVCAFQTHFHWNNFQKSLEQLYIILKDDCELVLACEKNKLSYHLKEYNNYSEMEKLVKKVGFSEIKEYTKGNNICYIIKK